MATTNDPVGYFLPSAAKATDIHRNIVASFQESLAWCFAQLRLADDGSAFAGDGYPRPVDFGHYYDMVVALSAPDASRIDLARAAARQLLDARSRASAYRGQRQPSSYGLDISTLREPWYDSAEVDCMIRWFDIEPENAMGMTALDEDELAAVTRQLQLALEAMAVMLPEFLQEMLAITTEIVFAKPSGKQKLTFGGVSSFSLWGAIALNAEAHPDWWLYLPRLVHEYSHNLLFGIARDTPLLLNDPAECYPSPLRKELRPLDGIYHAAFVSAREVLALRQMLARLDSDSRCTPYVHLHGYCVQTLAYSEQSFWDCLSVVRQHGRLTDLGREVLHDTERAMRNPEPATCSAADSPSDGSGQPRAA